MKNTFGNALTVTLFGESHGPAIGAVLDGLTPGIPVSEDAIRQQLARRRPAGRISTSRVEADSFEIISGVYSGKTTGTPLTVIIRNENTRSGDYASIENLARPGHADYTAQEKYHGAQDPRGGGHFSGRITAALVAAGAILREALAARGITILAHISELAGIRDRAFTDMESDASLLQAASFPTLDGQAGLSMQNAILAAAADSDSVGGCIELTVGGMPAGVGEPWFDSVESRLSHSLFSVPAVKGVEFGDGFAIAGLRGSQANDALCRDGGRIVTATNHNGGINGGITNGMPLVIRLAVKPTPTIAKEQNTVNFVTGEATVISAGGRHDPCLVHRALPVCEAVTALTLADLLAERYGTDWALAECHDTDRKKESKA